MQTGRRWILGIASDSAGAFLFAANSPNLVAVFTINADGTLSDVSGSPFPAGQTEGLRSLTSFPGKIDTYGCATSLFGVKQGGYPFSFIIRVSRRGTDRLLDSSVFGNGEPARTMYK